MYKDILKEMAGIEIYPLISLSIFFLFFVGLTVYVIFLKKEKLETLSNIPLENDTEQENNEN